MFIPEEMNWDEHNERARSMGGHLASITSAEENDEVTRVAYGRSVWIGGMRKGTGNGPGAEHWLWADGRPWAYTNWGHGEPNNYGGGENRIQLHGAHRGLWNDVGVGWRGPAVYIIPVSLPYSVVVERAGSSEVNGTYVFKPGEHENRHWDTIAGHYQHTQNPELFIAFQDCGTAHQRPEWNKWMIISKIGVLYAAHTGGKIGVPPREGGWETVDSWGNPGAPGGKHPAPTVGPAENKDAQRIEHPSETSSQGNFEYIPVSEYDEVWNDKGSGAKQDVSIWRARVPAGCHLIGMTAKNGHSRPTFSTLVVRAGGSDIAPPERFELVWWQERGQRRFWCWRPIPPSGYASLGDVGTLSEDPPSRSDVVCVALGCLSPNTQPLGGQIWNDSGGGAPKDAAFFTRPGRTGLFHCSDNTHSKPYDEFHLPASTSTSPYATQEIGIIEILEAVAGKPVRFRINNRPSSNDAWVGIYPKDTRDQDHGEQNKRWKWLREIDVNNASFPKQAEGSWSIRVFSNGGYTLHQRKDFQVKARHVGTQPIDVAAAKSKRSNVKIAMVVGICLLIPGLGLFIGGHGPPGEEQLGMIIPGAILLGVGGFLTVVASFFALSLRSESYAESNPTPDRNDPKAPAIEVLDAIKGKPIRFRINDHPGSSSAWVGIYPSSTPDDDYGEEGDRWNWLNKIDVSNAAFPEKSEGRWSIRVFADRGFTTHRRLDFDIIPKKERWWED